MSSIPNEILRDIFKYFTPRRPEHNFRITLTHVCRRWRAIAIELHSLWTFPDFRSPELATEMLKRSGGAPLHIEFKYTKHSRKTNDRLPKEVILARTETLYDTHRHLPRLKTLKLLRMSPRVMENLAAKYVQAAPNLRSLELQVQSGDGYDLPLNFLGGHAPLLRRLILDDCGLAYNSPLTHNLTSLELTGSKTAFAQLFCMALRFMPVLKRLSLNEVYCNDPGDGIIAVLPKLHRLDLNFSLLEGTSIFKHISFPATTYVQVDIHVSESESESEDPELATIGDVDSFWRDIGRILAPGFCPEGERVVKTLEVDGDDVNDGLSFAVRGWDTVVPWDSMLVYSDNIDTRPFPNLQVVVDWSELEGDESISFFEDLFKAAFHALRLPMLETLCFAEFPGWQDGTYSEHNFLVEALRPHLWTAPIQTLILSVEHSAMDIPVLLAYQSPDSDQPLPLPTLETLVLNYFTFEHELVDDLYNSLKRRMRRGMKLKKQVVRNSENYSGSDLKSFREVVEEVDWDEDYAIYIEEEEEEEESAESEADSEGSGYEFADSDRSSIPEFQPARPSSPRRWIERRIYPTSYYGASSSRQ
ncbi:hypothetical protein VNI00_015693 [Paramarasmius palmivorus]|uniref:F-box domain-containing protein n=1 Tax=Paramarasmius palmivorus TaxID=297713 RepID=A0AAW0BIA7_9AGAR